MTDTFGLRVSRLFGSNMKRPEVKSYVDKWSVYLNLYDMVEFNNYFELIGLGVYHSAVEIFNSEYFYGGYPRDSTGIFRIEPKSAERIESAFKYKETIFIGWTKANEQKVRQLLTELGKTRFKANKYHLFRNNCNHFTNFLVERLCGKQIPSYVNRMARIGTQIPFLESILPPEVLTPVLNSVGNEDLSQSDLDSKRCKRQQSILLVNHSRNYIV